MNALNSEAADLTRNLQSMTVVIALALMVCACGDDDSPTSQTPPPDDGTVLPTEVGAVSDEAARNNVVSNLENAYERLMYEEYDRLIHAEYVFRVDPAEVDIVGAAELSAFEDLESTFRMFSGETGVEPVLDPVTGRPTGELTVVPPVHGINLDLDPETGAWIASTDPRFAGSFERVYRITMSVTYSGDSRIDQIRGMQVFYATPGTLRNDNSGKLYWQLRGWADQGIDSGTEHWLAALPTSANSVSTLKARF
jgi:uncharacterized lipoprotein YehR (DUF1307 family)